MSTLITRAQPVTAGPASPRSKRSVGAAEVDQRLGRERAKPKAVQARGSASPIRAWRAAENAASEQEAPGLASATASAPRHPFGEGGSGPRRSATERAARMRAVEQAWKDEHARQAELEDD